MSGLFEGMTVTERNSSPEEPNKQEDSGEEDSSMPATSNMPDDVQNKELNGSSNDNVIDTVKEVIESSDANDANDAEEILENGTVEQVEKTDDDKPLPSEVPNNAGDSEKVESNGISNDTAVNAPKDANRDLLNEIDGVLGSDSDEDDEPASSGKSTTEDISSSPPATPSSAQKSATEESEKSPAPPKSQPPIGAFKNLPPATQTTTSESPQFSTDHELTNTPVLNPGAILRLLAKFTEKAAAAIPQSATNRTTSFFSRLFGGSSYSFDAASTSDPCLKAFSILLVAVEDDEPSSRQSLSSFVHLFSTWAHSRSSLNLLSSQDATDGNETHNYPNWVTSELLCMCIDTAQNLVAHGCLDHFYLILPSQNEPVKAIHVLAESVFLSELSDELTELASLKFLLSTGCRVMEGGSATNVANHPKEGDEKDDTRNLMPAGEAMLRGTYLLQTIRVCYHVFLKTGSPSNKITARAALQQVVASVFVRMERSSENLEALSSALESAPSNTSVPESMLDGEDKIPVDKSSGGISFPTEDHRDAFLVLRSLCKLSMKVSTEGRQPGPTATHQLPEKKTEGDEDNDATLTDDVNPPNSSEDGASPGSPSNKPRDRKQYSSQMMSDAIVSVSNSSPLSSNPALESKILALELILYILSLDYQSGASNQPNHLSSSQPFQFAIRHYLCVSLLKNTTSNITQVVGLSLRIFVPLIRLFRSQLKTEIEAFVTNVFFVILDSKNSTIEHKSLVVTLFEEICSDPDTLAEIFLNYDCDLSAVDLFHRIVNTLGKVAKIDENNPNAGTELAPSELEALVGSVEKRKAILRQSIRQLRLDAMRALRQVLASLYASIVVPFDSKVEETKEESNMGTASPYGSSEQLDESYEEEKKQNPLVQIYDSKKKFKEEQLDIILRFNRSPAKGIAYAGECGHLDASDPVEVAKYLLKNGKDTSKMEKTQIGEYLGREAEYQKGFCLEVLQEYASLLDFEEMDFDEAIRYFLSGFRLPGEAQKIDRIMEKFAERYCIQNPSIFTTADAAFILSFAVIMLNTDLHNPAIKEERRMTKDAFIRMNRGICEGEDLPDELLKSIFDRIRINPISLKEDDEARERAGEAKPGATGTPGLSPGVFFGNHYDEVERARESNYLKERDQILRRTELLFKRKRRSRRKSSSSRLSNTAHSKFVRTQDTGLRDEYVTPMFEVTWGVCLAVFSTALENANGTASVSAMAKFSEEEMEMALDNAMETTEVCLAAIRLAICTSGLCGNETARGAFFHALKNFTLLGTGKLMEHRHVRCVQALLKLGHEDGELLGDAWEHVLAALSEVSRLVQVYDTAARHERVEMKRELRIQRDMAGEDISDDSESDDDESIDLEPKDMDRRSIDEANSLSLHDAVPETYVDGIFQRSSSLSPRSVKDFILQLCRVSRMEISGYGGHVGSRANQVEFDDSQQRANQPIIYSLQKLVEVAHYNMDSRPRLIFADLWSTISGHLTSTALHANPAVAMYAVDSFRQLSIHFLQKEELGVFEFQKRFLKPFEAVMSGSEYVTTKELLLSCIEQIILRFGHHKRQQQGMLRSGWRPVLTVLGLTGHDVDDTIANAGFKMLNGQLEECLAKKDLMKDGDEHSTATISLVTEHFVTLVDALVIFVSGKRMQMSLKAIDHLVKLSTLIADGAIPLPSSRKRTFGVKLDSDDKGNVDDEERPLQLQLWWPILLGLSQSIGDRRRAVREKSLRSLLDLVNTFFLSITNIEDMKNGTVTEEAKQYHLQTLQLIFRGIFIPTLEYAETDMDGKSAHPRGFPHFITNESPQKPISSSAPISPYEDLLVNDDDMNDNSWIFTTFGPLLDGCISICLEAMQIYKSDSLIEEVLAVINSCLLSDSGALAVTGLRRLHKFITIDLSMDLITDDTWAVVCHMLRRCLSVRGLGSVLEAVERRNLAFQEDKDVQEEDNILINEFIMEEKMYSGKRYVGCNATMVIGTLLCDGKIADCIGKKWYLFLLKGLAIGIKDWEGAAEVMGFKIENSEDGECYPPHYLENALYGMQWMTKLILMLAAEDITEAEDEALMKSRQLLLQEQTQNIFRTFIEKESNMDGLVSTSPDDLMLSASKSRELGYITRLVSELLDGYIQFNDEKLAKLAWLCPMMSPLIQSNNRAVRVSVQQLVSRMFEGPLAGSFFAK